MFAKDNVPILKRRAARPPNPHGNVTRINRPAVTRRKRLNLRASRRTPSAVRRAIPKGAKSKNAKRKSVMPTRPPKNPLAMRKGDPGKVGRNADKTERTPEKSERNTDKTERAPER
jgi:hypothetical protein